MLLAIDIGNTQTVLGLFHESQLKHTWRFSTHPVGTSREFRNRLESAIQPNLMSEVKAIVIASVVPALTQIAREAFSHVPLRVIDHTWPFSFAIKTESPQQTGTDRLVNAEAAIRDYGFPCIIVDSGTATTICGVSKSPQGQAEFLGGAIIPGLKLSMEALLQNTAQLFKVELTPPPRAIGGNTDEALRSGLLFGYASMIDGMVRRFKEELGISDLPVIATGGVSHLMKGLLKEQTHFDFNLTLRGIAYLHDSILKR